MAVMIPSSGPRQYLAESREGVLYHALEKLPDDFYVVHSLNLLTATGGVVRENEADFVVFNPSLGILCIEAKAGQASYTEGEWRYGSGLSMKHGGPYHQAAYMKYRIIDQVREALPGDAPWRCKALHAVWFPSLRRQDFLANALPPEADPAITLCLEDIDDPEPRIRAIFALEVEGIHMDLSKDEADAIVGRVLCPEFKVVPTKRYRYDLADSVFARLLDSQARVLDFIVDQRTAAINGGAGTGKTLIAMERARRAAAEGGKVLFLCFNKLLQQDIAKKLEGVAGVDVRTIAAYACSVCGLPKPDYELLAERLMEHCEAGDFPYDHVIIDESQDFGIAEIDAACILDLLQEVVLAKSGTFYLFYDRNQFIQGSAIPSVIDRADCKLTLYVNCRNTEGIATCSQRSIGRAAGEVMRGARTSGPPQLFASEDAARQAEFVDRQIAELKGAGINDIVVLTCKTDLSSALSGYFGGGPGGRTWGRSGVPVTTCRKFKGLEADAVILVDVDETLWRKPEHDYEPEPGLLFYTGASRAKHELRIVCNMGERGCSEVLETLGVSSKRKPISRLAKQLNAVNVSGGV